MNPVLHIVASEIDIGETSERLFPLKPNQTRPYKGKEGLFCASYGLTHIDVDTSPVEKVFIDIDAWIKDFITGKGLDKDRIVCQIDIPMGLGPNSFLKSIEIPVYFLEVLSLQKISVAVSIYAAEK